MCVWYNDTNTNSFRNFRYLILCRLRIIPHTNTHIIHNSRTEPDECCCFIFLLLLLLLFAVLSCMSPKGWYTFVLPLLVRATEDDNRTAHVWCLGKYHKFQKPLMGCVCSALAIKTEMNTDRMKNGSSTFRRDTQFCSAYFSTLVLQYKPNKQGNSSSLHLHNWIICNKYRMRESHAYHAQPTPIDTRRY